MLFLSPYIKPKRRVINTPFLTPLPRGAHVSTERDLLHSFRAGSPRGPLRWILQGWCLSPTSSHLPLGIPRDNSMWQWQCICSLFNTTTTAIRNQSSSSHSCSCHSCPSNAKICKCTICFSSFPHLQGWQWSKTPLANVLWGPMCLSCFPQSLTRLSSDHSPRLPLANPVMRVDSEPHSIQVTDAGFHQDPGSETAVFSMCE